MHRTFLLISALLALVPVAHAYPGVNLRWTSCYGDGGTINRNFACDTNSGSHVLVGSFVLYEDMVQVSGTEIVVDLAAADATLPAWWQFRNAGTCRQGSLGLGTVGTGTACPDWANGQSIGLIASYQTDVYGANTARLTAAAAVPVSAFVDLYGGQEYFSHNLSINNAKTVGTGACGGCTIPVCIVFLAVRLTTPVASNDRRITGSANGFDSFYATWQGGGVPTTRRGTGCPSNAVPTRSRTWRELKSLYR